MYIKKIENSKNSHAEKKFQIKHQWQNHYDAE